MSHLSETLVLVFDSGEESGENGDRSIGCADAHTATMKALAWLKVAISADTACLSDCQAVEAAKAQQQVLSLAAGVSGHLGHDLASRGEALVDLGLTVDQLLASELHEDRQAIRKRLHTAKIINRYYPDLDKALMQGRVSWSHCETFVSASNPRIHVDLAEFQTLLIELAEATNFDKWRKELRGICDRLDHDGGHNPANDPTNNRLSLVSDSFGLILKGQLVGDAETITREVIEKVTDELFAKYSADRAHDPALHVPTRNELRAQALTEICRRAVATDIHSSKPPGTQATIVIHEDRPDRYDTLDGETHRTHGSGLCCDARTQNLTVDPAGVPLNMGRTRRLATPAQRKAISVRDGGCVFPDCDAPHSWCVIHHVTPWEPGGTTDLNNLATLCNHHHGITHTNGWKMRTNPDQTFQWSTPTGRNIRSQRHGTKPPKTQGTSPPRT